MLVKPGQDDFEGRRASQVKIEEPHKALVECARADLGLGLPAQPRSLLGKLLAWPGLASDRLSYPALGRNRHGRVSRGIGRVA